MELKLNITKQAVFNVVVVVALVSLFFINDRRIFFIEHDYYDTRYRVVLLSDSLANVYDGLDDLQRQLGRQGIVVH